MTQHATGRPFVFAVRLQFVSTGLRNTQRRYRITGQLPAFEKKKKKKAAANGIKFPCDPTVGRRDFAEAKAAKRAA